MLYLTMKDILWLPIVWIRYFWDKEDVMIIYFYLKDQCVARIFFGIINYYVFQGMGGVSYPHPFMVNLCMLLQPLHHWKLYFIDFSHFDHSYTLKPFCHIKSAILNENAYVSHLMANNKLQFPFQKCLTRFTFLALIIYMSNFVRSL